MKIGRLEIRWIRDCAPCRTVWPERDLHAFFAVPELEPWWLAVHQAVEEVERECIEGSRKYVANTNQCIAAVGAGEGAALIRQRLIEKRAYAIQEAKKLRREAG